MKINKTIINTLIKNEFISNKYSIFFFYKKVGKSSRRDFLKWIGFGTALATLAACKGPVIRSIPYVIKPESIIPGIPTYYASTMYDGFDLANVLVKTREGRPIKIEPNTNAPHFKNTSARIQASILSLYDSERLKGPSIKGNSVTWDILDKYVIEKLSDIKSRGKQIVLLFSSLPSPSSKELLKDFFTVFPNSRLVTYDAYSYSSALEATKDIFGIRALPHYDLSKIELIVSFNADFLRDWSPENIENEYSKRRNPKINMIRHIQIESNMSLTGANADIRIPLKYSKIKELLVDVYEFINGNTESNNNIAKKIAKEIKEKADKAVIFSSCNKEDYALSLLINKKIQSKALSTSRFILIKESNDKEFINFIKDLKKDKIGAVLCYNTNPLYSFSESKQLKKLFEKIDLSISFASKKDETSKVMKVYAPTPHWLESWGDSEPITGLYTIMQPTIQPVFNTRQVQDSLILWTKNCSTLLDYSKINNYYDYLRLFWERKILPFTNVSSFNKALFNGFANTTSSYKKILKLKKISFRNFIIKHLKIKGYELELYLKNAIGDGTQANNPWLQEFPDPITRTTWENYLTLSPKDAKKLHIKNWNIGDGAMNGNSVNLIFGKVKFKNLPVLIQPGQAIGSMGLAFGYGGLTGKTAFKSVGVNGYKIYKKFSVFQNGIKLKKVNHIHEFACIQLQNTVVGRSSIARETDLETFLKTPKEVWNEEEQIETYRGKLITDKVSLWKERDRSQGHHFNLLIDLNACIGCGACIIACHSENNVPVVGKNEIRKSRDMHWLRIDRYYSTKENFKSLAKHGLSQQNMFYEPDMYSHLLKSKDNPKVIFQPLMCQHCSNAPCETVCPVGATSHGGQGQNMMAYNRCVGTRYCANNCPYKVRRFNWFNYSENEKFDYYLNNDIGRMVLNPDVVIRSRGVMEKCSLCIQMTQATILKAKKEGRKLKDEELQTSCTKVCPTKAIVFGDINDNKSKISEKIKDKRSYKLLNFLGTRPNVFYQVKIRNAKK
jgi:molybdopterin-containing oxidoreductase family iron-sulfur binding subunit